MNWLLLFHKWVKLLSKNLSSSKQDLQQILSNTRLRCDEIYTLETQTCEWLEGLASAKAEVSLEMGRRGGLCGFWEALWEIADASTMPCGAAASTPFILLPGPPMYLIPEFTLCCIICHFKITKTKLKITNNFAKSHRNNMVKVYILVVAAESCAAC